MNMIPYPNINPDLFRIGPVHVRWYGLMYALGFLASYLLIKHQEKSKPVGLSLRKIQDLMFYLAIGLLAGGRLGYLLFKNASIFRSGQSTRRVFGSVAYFRAYFFSLYLSILSLRPRAAAACV